MEEVSYYTLYLLAFLASLGLCLVVHEWGHLVIARWQKVRVCRFQIGIGPRILSIYAGKERLGLPAGVETPESGSVIVAQLEEQPDGSLVLANWRRKNEKDRRQGQYPEIEGRVGVSGEGWVEFKGMCWSLAALPVAALVILPENPREGSRTWFNRATRTTRVTIALAGVGSNILLTVAAAVLLAFIPPGQVAESSLVIAVQPGQPAAESGIVEGDTIVLSPRELNEAVRAAWESGGTVELEVRDPTLAVRTVSVKPDPVQGRIGIIYQGVGNGRSSGDDRNFFLSGLERLRQISVVIPVEAGELVRGETETPEGESKVTGIVGAAAYSTGALREAGFRAWLAVTMTVSISVAAVNLLPIPPLDGAKAAMELVASSDRRGRERQKRMQEKLELLGLGLIAIVALYLAVQDVTKLTGG